MARTAITVIGENGAQLSDLQSKTGTTSYLSGYTGIRQGGRRLLVQNNSVWTLSGDFTVECWVYVDEDFNSTATSIFHHREFTNGPGLGLICGANPNNFFLQDLGSGGTLITGSTVFSVDNWYHLTVERSGSTLKLYVNGTLEGSTTYTYNHTQNMTIGNIEYATVLGFPGLIDEFRVSDIPRYNSNFTPIETSLVNDANTLLLLHLDGNDGDTTFIDDNSEATVIVEASANLTATATLQAELSTTLGYFSDDYIAVDYFIDPTSVTEAEASLTMASSMSVEGIIVDATAYFLGDYIADDYIADVQFVFSGLITLDASFAQGIPVAQITRPGAGDLFVSANLVTTATRIKQLEFAGVTLFTPSIQASLTKDGDIDCLGQFGLACSPEITRSLESNLDSAATMSTIGTKLKGVFSDQSVAASLTVDGVVTYGSVRSLLHLDTVTNGQISDEVASNTWNGPFTIGNNYALTGFSNNLVYDTGSSPYDLEGSEGNYYDADGANFPAPLSGGLEGVTVDPSERLIIGQEDFSVDFWFRIGESHYYDAGAASTRIPIWRYGWNEAPIVNGFWVEDSYLMQLYLDPTDQNYPGGPFGTTLRFVTADPNDSGMSFTIPPIYYNDWLHIEIKRYYDPVGPGLAYTMQMQGLGGSLPVNFASSLVNQDIRYNYDPTGRDHIMSLGGYSRFQSYIFEPGTSNPEDTRVTSFGTGPYFGGGIEEFRLLIGNVRNSANSVDISTPYDEWFNGQARLEPRATLTASLAKIELGESLQTVSATMSITPSRVRLFAGNLFTQADTTTTPSRIRDFEVDLSTIATVFAVELSAARLAEADLNANAQLDIDLVRLRSLSTSIFAQAALTCDTEVLKPFTANLDFNFTSSTDTLFSVTRTFEIDTDAIATQLVAASKIGEVLITIEPRATMLVNGNLTSDTIVNLTVNADIDVELNGVKPFSANLNTTALMSTNNGFIRQFDVDLNAESTTSIDLSRIRTVNTPLTAVFTDNIVPQSVKPFEAALNTQATITAIPQVFVITGAELVVTASHVFVLGKFARGVVDMQSIVSTLTAGRPINIDLYRQLMVPQETRFIKVLEETKIIQVDQETRVLKI